jgi:RHS repeat-associated protein
VEKRKTLPGTSSPEITGYLIDSANLTGWPQCIAEVQPASGGVWTAQTTYTYGPHGPLSQWSATQGEHQFLLDAHGSVRGLVDATGNVVTAADYDAYGLKLSTEPPGAPKTNLGYNGEHYDEDLGLIYLRARWYDPASGRFHTRDPYQGTFDDPMSQQGYLYAHADPVNNIDPSGNFSLFELTATQLLGRFTQNIQTFMRADNGSMWPPKFRYLRMLVWQKLRSGAPRNGRFFKLFHTRENWQGIWRGVSNNPGIQPKLTNDGEVSLILCKKAWRDR